MSRGQATEAIKNVFLALIICGAIGGTIAAISYFVWDYNVQLQQQRAQWEIEHQKQLVEKEKTRQAWIQAVEGWDGKVLVVPERLIVEEDTPRFNPLQPTVPGR